MRNTKVAIQLLLGTPETSLRFVCWFVCWFVCLFMRNTKVEIQTLTWHSRDKLEGSQNSEGPEMRRN